MQMKKIILFIYFVSNALGVFYTYGSIANWSKQYDSTKTISGYNIKPINEERSSYSVQFHPSLKVQRNEILNEMNSRNTKKRSVTQENLILLSSTTDNLGITHSKYQQYINGIPIEGSMLIIHEKAGSAIFMNGQYFENIDINTTPLLDIKSAIRIFSQNEDSLLYKKSNALNPQLVIAPLNGIYTKENLTLCYKISTSEWTFYINAHTGGLVNKISNRHKISVEAKTSTVYSGEQTIATHFKNGRYFLYDSIRNIYTYDGTNDSAWINGNPFKNPTVISNETNIWDQYNYITQVIISSVSSQALGEGDDIPDLYIDIRDSANKLVYRSGIAYNTSPPILFSNINIPIQSTHNYTISIIDKDNTTDNELCGTFSFNTKNGSVFSSDSVSGTIGIKGNDGSVAGDVHWGMSKTYDYYWAKFTRKSFDGNGDTIHNWLNPHFIQDWDHNNAFSLHAYNFGTTIDIMCYGLGDGKYMNPVVTLDILAHEFTHLVTYYTSELIYQGESGALNEAFSDMFAVCVEHYAKGDNANWTIGEGAIIPTPYLRSLKNPNSIDLIGQIKSETGTLYIDLRQPDTYLGERWQNTSDISQDYGGVHNNNGVPNYWFYLLTEGGSGTNDLDLEYDVMGIGIQKSEQIIYHTITSYLTPASNFNDAYYATLSATEALFGANSDEWWAVKNAWYAVGVNQTDPNLLCSGQINFSEQAGTITDGSGDADYAPDSYCKWLIAPIGATSITLKVTKFDIMDENDALFIFSSTTPSNLAIIDVLQGNNLPGQDYVIDGGAVLLLFVSDNSSQSAGWEIEYSATTIAGCHGTQILTNEIGSISDNSAYDENYGNNQNCLWAIAPAGMDSVLINFRVFATEENYDYVYIYDGEPTFGNDYQLIIAYSGTQIPKPLMVYSDEVWVRFSSDPFMADKGFELEYTAYTSPFCSGIKIITSDYGEITDGSGDSAYYKNSECGWLIMPQDVASVTLMFNEISLEAPEADGRTYYDYIEVFDGTDINAPLLGKFASNEIPYSIESSGNAMLVMFHSNMSKEYNGFSATFFSETLASCYPDTLTAPREYVNDGSFEKQYSNNISCMKLINPQTQMPVHLSFTEFDTEQNKDILRIYDGQDTSATMLAELSGNQIPKDLTAESGSILLWFTADEKNRFNGWEAYYYSDTATQTINLNQGWNLISLYIHPHKNTIQEIFKSTLNQIDVIKTDNAFYSIQNPLYLNSLTSFEGGQAYVIKSNESVSFTIDGFDISPESKEKISEIIPGWQMKGMPYFKATSIDSCFDLENIEALKDFDNFFEINNPLNSIIELKPGQGYFVKGKDY